MIALLLIVSQTFAVDLSTMVGVAGTGPSTSVVAGRSGFGLGALLGWGVHPFFSLETGVLMLEHTLATGTTMSTYTMFDVPLMLRFSPISLVAVGAGVYYGYQSGFKTTRGPAVIGAVKDDYGAIFDASVRLPLAPLMKLRIDALYEYGFAQLANSFSSRNVSTFVGLMLDL